MDPVSIFATAVAVAKTVDLLAKSIKLVSDLRSQWKTADLEVATFETQLIAVSAALVKIRDWLNRSRDARDEFLTDVGRCVGYCELLVRIIDKQVSKLQRVDANDKLDTHARVRLLFKAKDMSDAQKMLERVTSALTLLLAACNR